MGEINEVRFSGTIERLKSVNTKKGTTMITLLLKVGQDRFKVVAFKNVADAILRCSDGDQISVAGSGSINSWKDNEGRYRNDFQLSVWKCEINGQTIEYQKNTSNGSQTIDSRDDGPPLPPEPDQRSEFDYAGGPF
jgi:single-stranded DNA-binding protein